MGGGHEAEGEGCDTRAPSITRDTANWFLFQPIPSSKEGWQHSASHQPQSPELIRSNGTLQDEGNTNAERPSSPGRLAHESGSEGCVLQHPITSSSPVSPSGCQVHHRSLPVPRP